MIAPDEVLIIQRRRGILRVEQLFNCCLVSLVGVALQFFPGRPKSGPSQQVGQMGYFLLLRHTAASFVSRALVLLLRNGLGLDAIITRAHFGDRVSFNLGEPTQ